MIGCLRTRVRKQPIIALYFESETGLKVYNLQARSDMMLGLACIQIVWHSDGILKTFFLKFFF